jgi:outer membrane translocation and assembly module TamA
MVTLALASSSCARRARLTGVLRVLRFLQPFALVAFVAATFVLTGCKTIPEGRSSVNEVKIIGAKQVDEDETLDKIATTESSKFLYLFRGILFEYSLFDRFVLQRDLARVESFYRSKGYYDAHARAGRVFQLDKNHVRVEVLVQENEPVLVRKVHIDGLDGMPPVIVTAAQTAVTTGLPNDKPFGEDEYKKTEGQIRRALSDNGYAYAKVSGDAAVDIVTHKADVVYKVVTGPKCTFGAVRLEGQGTLPTAPLLRTINITAGEPYSEKDLDDAQQALLDLGVLASVELIADVPGVKPPPAKDPAKPDADKPGTKNEEGVQGEGSGSPGAAGPPLGGPPVVPIVVKLEPSRLRTIRVGGGIEFDALKTDVHGLIGWESKNFFGGLRTFSIEFRPGVVLYPTRVNNIVAPTNPLPEERLRLELKQPGFPEARTNLFDKPEFNVYPVLINPNPPVNAPVLGYGEFRNAVGLERTLWKLYGSISHNLQVDYPFAYVGPKDPSLGLIVISYPELYTTLDFRDDKQHPHKGIFLSNRLQVAGQIFGGDANDFKVQPEARAYVPVTKKLVLATRATVGFLIPQNYGDTVRNGPLGAPPPGGDTDAAAHTRDFQLTYFRGFFSGGPTSNRGYPLRGVGPYDFVPFLSPSTAATQLNNGCTDASNKTNSTLDSCRSPTGGFTLWEASLEARYNVAGPLYVATFCDASDVSPRTGDIRLTHPHLSCGAGGRYDTPAGPIRLDIGYRIPGLQYLGPKTADEKDPDKLFGIPIAVSIGIGEAY